ncbi:MAG: hypothetical protein ACQGVK_07735 [Myxococcota bacterium]
MTSRPSGSGLPSALAALTLLGCGVWGCATPAPAVDLPALASVEAIEIDPECSAASCPPPRLVRDRREIAFRLALLHALNKDWQRVDPELCPDQRRRGRITYLDAGGRPVLVVWERVSSERVQLSVHRNDSGCQATPAWTREEYGSAMEAAQQLYGRMLQRDRPGEDR